MSIHALTCLLTSSQRVNLSFVLFKSPSTCRCCIQLDLWARLVGGVCPPASSQYGLSYNGPCLLSANARETDGANAASTPINECLAGILICCVAVLAAMQEYRTGTKSFRTLRYQIHVGLPALRRIMYVNTTYLLHVTVSYGVLRFKPRYPAGPSELNYIPQGH